MNIKLKGHMNVLRDKAHWVYIREERWTGPFLAVSRLLPVEVSSWPPVNWCRCRWDFSAKQSLKLAAKELVSVPLGLHLVPF